MTSSQHVLDTLHGDLLVTRPPVVATVNKAGANYKSEVTHLSYSPRRAFDEWVGICEAITRCGGDALFRFEQADDVYLGHDTLFVDAQGDIRVAPGVRVLGNLSSVETGRVFTANGPWVQLRETTLRVVMQNMLPHRRTETSYYEDLLTKLAHECGYEIEVLHNPHRWEGMADVAAVGHKVILTYAVSGHYDEGLTPKSSRSCRAGVAWAADQIGVPAEDRIYAELIYPHFHGDTVHFGARPPNGAPVLAHYAGGLWGTGAKDIADALGPNGILPIEREDAVEHYAGNSRQVRNGVLIPDTTSADFEKALTNLGLTCHRVPLFELFGKAGGGPGCATLYLPTNLQVPKDSPLRYSNQREAVAQRRRELPETLTVDPGFFADKQRG